MIFMFICSNKQRSLEKEQLNWESRNIHSVNIKTELEMMKEISVKCKKRAEEKTQEPSKKFSFN